MSLGPPSPSGATDLSDDHSLWLRLQDGHTDALASLYDRHAGLVYGTALKVLGSPQEAEDLTQDIFIRFADRRVTAYDPQRGSLRTFLAILTRSRAIDRLRLRQTQQSAMNKVRSQLDPQQASVPDLLSDSEGSEETSTEIQQALSQLSDSQQQVLRLAYYDGLSQADIAKQLGEPLGTVKARARRGLLKLKQILQDSLS